jgi:acyl dehydratase
VSAERLRLIQEGRLDLAWPLGYSGLNKVRFPAPLPVGSRIRARAQLKAVTDVANSGMEVVVVNIIERDGSDKPVCVAETVTRYYH